MVVPIFGERQDFYQASLFVNPALLATNVKLMAIFQGESAVILILSIIALVMSVLSLIKSLKPSFLPFVARISTKEKMSEENRKLIPSPEEMPERGWAPTGEKRWAIVDIAGKKVDRNNLLRWGFQSGGTTFYEKDGDRAAFTILRFSSAEGAKNAFKGISEEVKEARSYSTSIGTESEGFYGEAYGSDQVFFRRGNLLALATVGGRRDVGRGGSLPYARLFEDKIDLAFAAP